MTLIDAFCNLNPSPSLRCQLTQHYTQFLCKQLILIPPPLHPICKRTGDFLSNKITEGLGYLKVFFDNIISKRDFFWKGKDHWLCKIFFIFLGKIASYEKCISQSTSLRQHQSYLFSFWLWINFLARSLFTIRILP